MLFIMWPFHYGPTTGQRITLKNTSSNGLFSHKQRNKSTGLDKIPARLLKDSAHVIAQLITHIVNFSQLPAQCLMHGRKQECCHCISQVDV